MTFDEYFTNVTSDESFVTNNNIIMYMIYREILYYTFELINKNPNISFDDIWENIWTNTNMEFPDLLNDKLKNICYQSWLELKKQN